MDEIEACHYYVEESEETRRLARWEFQIEFFSFKIRLIDWIKCEFSLFEFDCVSNIILSACDVVPSSLRSPLVVN